MNDKELLQRAAKARGIEGVYYKDESFGEEEWFSEGIYITDENDVGHTWNPLVDDGDALRLAVKLDMIIVVNRVDGCTEATCGYNNDDLVNIKESHGNPFAATRRAIVLAAAARVEDARE